MENEFKWTDALVKEFWLKLMDYFNQGHSFESAAKDFKKSKELSKEKGYEILSFHDADFNDIEKLERQTNGTFKNCFEPIAHDERYLLMSKYPIHSVRRKSDNAIFSLGDKSNYGIIQSFVISDFGMYAQMEYGKKNLKELEKIKEPVLFTTDQIYEIERIIKKILNEIAPNKK